MPCHWLGALFNGDYTCLSNEEEKEINNFLDAVKGVKGEHVVDLVNDEISFEPFNDAGTLPCDCYECYSLILNIHEHDIKEKKIFRNC